MHEFGGKYPHPRRFSLSRGSRALERVRSGLTFRRVVVTGVIAMASAMTALPGIAQSYPDKPIEIINSFSPGGTSDLNIRALEAAASRVLGQPLVQTFKQGGGGITGSTEVAHSKPDGYRLLIVTPGELTAAPNLAKTTYSLDSFDFIAQLSTNPYGLAVRSDAPWKDFEEFRRSIIAQPDKHTFGTAPRGGVFLAVQHLIRHGNLRVRLVPYGGSGPYITAVLGGHVDAALAPVTSTEQHLKAGTLRLLAVTGGIRLKDHPDVPTLRELGIDSPFELWVGIVGPKGIPPERLAHLRDSFARITRDPAYLKAAEKLSVGVAYLPTAEFEKRVRDEDREFKLLVKELGLGPK
jgi:tripartite-type tricarboxylate transporter receptor subunit TctC